MRRNIDEKACTATVWDDVLVSKTTVCPAAAARRTGKFCNNCGASMALNKCATAGWKTPGRQVLQQLRRADEKGRTEALHELRAELTRGSSLREVRREGVKANHNIKAALETGGFFSWEQMPAVSCADKSQREGAFSGLLQRPVSYGGLGGGTPFPLLGGGRDLKYLLRVISFRKPILVAGLLFRAVEGHAVLAAVDDVGVLDDLLDRRADFGLAAVVFDGERDG